MCFGSALPGSKNCWGKLQEKYASCYIIRIFDARSYLRFKVAHGRIIVNLVVVIYMASVAVLEPMENPALNYLQLIVLFILVALFNFEAVLSTLKKVIKK